LLDKRKRKSKKNAGVMEKTSSENVLKKRKGKKMRFLVVADVNQICLQELRYCHSLLVT
jgi:hypothetical protein